MSYAGQALALAKEVAELKAEIAELKKAAKPAPKKTAPPPMSPFGTEEKTPKVTKKKKSSK